MMIPVMMKTTTGDGLMMKMTPRKRRRREVWQLSLRSMAGLCQQEKTRA
jgi:hypothetical protein